MQLRKPEIMSPAGYWPQLRAAIEGGADSVYFGLHHFTARAKVGFTIEELPDALRELHSRGVKGYVTFNTLIFDEEIDEAEQSLVAIARAGADAIIVQDLAIARMAKEIAPDLAIHGSTQMSITSAEGVRFAQELGVSRVVLARELSLDEIRAIRSATDCELEMFVHGALCVSYSGQCFSSEAWGGRSANRGQCAQACRLPYEMIVDGKPRPLGDARYLLSPGDLYTLRQIPEILRAGVSALKIEGRYKDADYVALTTHAYRNAVDQAWSGSYTTSREEELRLEQVYSRGLGPWFVTGTNHQAVVKGRAPRHRGVMVGRVGRVTTDSVVIEPAVPVKAGDGVVFDAADWRSPQLPEEGGSVYEATAIKGGRVELRFANGAIAFERIRTGDLVWRTHDPEIDRLAKAFLTAANPVHKQPVNVRVVARQSECLRADWSLAAKPEIAVTVEAPVETAANNALSREMVQTQFSRLGNTAYELGRLDVEIEGSPFVPVSVLNRMRREAVEALARMQSEPGSVRIERRHRTQRQSQPATGLTELHLLVRTSEQLEAAIEQRPASITLDYLDLYGLQPSLDRLHAAGIPARVAAPRILKPGEEKIAQFLVKLGQPILVRSTGLLWALRASEHPALTGDFSLNAANTGTAEMLLNMGLERITPTHDLNGKQIAELARRLGPEPVEAVAYQHLPVFHTEHCVFCRFLSNGASYRDCGRPCEKHQVALRDEHGREHPVIADVGCRNTVFGAEAQEASAHLDRWREAGIRHFRIEFAHESAEEVRAITMAFADALGGRMAMGALAQRIREASPRGTTQGSLFIPIEQLAPKNFRK